MAFEWLRKPPEDEHLLIPEEVLKGHRASGEEGGTIVTIYDSDDKRHDIYFIDVEVA